MQIDELGTLTAFEPMPTEQVYHFALVSYGTMWATGPCGTDKAKVIEALQTSWKDCAAARIYSVKLPVNALPAQAKEPT